MLHGWHAVPGWLIHETASIVTIKQKPASITELNVTVSEGWYIHNSVLVVPATLAMLADSLLPLFNLAQLSSDPLARIMKTNILSTR